MSESQSTVDLGEVVMIPVSGTIEQPPASELTTAPAKKRGRPSKAEIAAREAAEGQGTTEQEKTPQAADDAFIEVKETPAPAPVQAAVDGQPVPDGVEGEVPVLGVYLMNSGSRFPTPATTFSAGADVRANFVDVTDVTVFTAANKQSGGVVRENFGVRSIVLQPGSRAKIPTGLIFDIPVGWKITVHPRSGQSLKQGLNLANCVAVIDYDYTDQLYILVANTSQLRVEITQDDRIAQMSLEKVYPYELKVLSGPPQPKSERAGGIGSTGVQ